MNAELGTNYDIEKMVNWSFDQSSKRNWGTIVGSWGDSGNIDVSGLVGEVDNPNTGYAFAMNGFEQAAALVEDEVAVATEGDELGHASIVAGTGVGSRRVRR
jgi:hypothetical protein